MVHKQVALLAAIERNQEDVVRSFVVDPTFDPSFNDNEAIRRASRLKGRTSIIKLLLYNSKVDPAARDNEAIREAAANGDQRTVFALLASGKVDPGARDSEALRKIVAAPDVYDRSAVIMQMLAYASVDPSANDNEALISAVCTDSHSVLRLFLADKRVDPSARGNEALMSSVMCKSYDCFKELLGNERVDPFVRDFEVIRLMAQEDRAIFMKGFLRHPRVRCRDDYKTILGLALEQTMARSAMVTAGAFITLGYGAEMVGAAVRFGDAVMIEGLLALARLDVNEFLRIAASDGKAWIVRQCLKHPKIRPGDSYTAAVEGARRNGHWAIVRLLNEHKRNLPAPEATPGVQSAATLAPGRERGSRKGRPASVSIVEAAMRTELVPRSQAPSKRVGQPPVDPSPTQRPSVVQVASDPARRAVTSGKKADKPSNIASDAAPIEVPPILSNASQADQRCDLFTRKHKAAAPSPGSSSSPTQAPTILAKRRRLGSSEKDTSASGPDTAEIDNMYRPILEHDSMYRPTLAFNLLLSAARNKAEGEKAAKATMHGFVM